MEYKSIGYELKDLDEKKGVVQAYANAYNNEDAAGDISDLGSFTKSVKENKSRLRVLKDHDRRISLGVPLNVDPYDKTGLLTTTQFNMQKEVSRDMFTDVILYKENNMSAELSVGVDIVTRDVTNRKIVKEYRLWEYSFLTAWAANELATVNSIKGLEESQNIIDLIQKAYNLPYSDSRLRQIETVLKSLTLEPGKTTLEDEPMKEKELADLMRLTYKKHLI